MEVCWTYSLGKQTVSTRPPPRLEAVAHCVGPLSGDAVEREEEPWGAVGYLEFMECRTWRSGRCV